MRTLGFTPQRPLSRAYEQDPVLVERWKAEEYPKIQRLARKENALIFPDSCINPALFIKKTAYIQPEMHIA